MAVTTFSWNGSLTAAVADWARGVEYHQVRNTETANVAYPDRRYGRLCLTALIGLFFFSIFGQS
jgi:predicted Zn-dependent protease